jgi:hypothetical protein
MGKKEKGGNGICKERNKYIERKKGERESQEMGQNERKKERKERKKIRKKEK